MAGTAVQFYGADEVIKAYDLQGLEPWAIFTGKDLFARGMTGDELQSYLDLLKKSPTDAIYRLKVYDDITDVKQIRERTEGAGGFGFKMSQRERVGSAGYTYNLELEERLKKLEDPDDDDDDNGIMGKIGNAAISLISNPTELVQVIGAIKELFAAPSMQQAQVVGKIYHDLANPVKAEVVPMKNDADMTDDEKQRRLIAAIDTLGRNDEKAVEHLEKLAKISQENPAMFKMLIMNLDNF